MASSMDGTDQKRDRVIRRLIGIINQYTTQGFAIALPKADYDAAIPDGFQKETREASLYVVREDVLR